MDQQQQRVISQYLADSIFMGIGLSILLFVDLISSSASWSVFVQ